MDAMVEIEEAKCASRKDADEIMQRTEPVRMLKPSQPAHD
jgi:hypothetical protein